MAFAYEALIQDCPGRDARAAKDTGRLASPGKHSDAPAQEDRLPTKGSPSRVAAVFAPARAYAAGDVIAQKYELSGLIGSGGMGAVWVARHRGLDAEVALKLVRSELSDGSTAHRFLSEARLLARIEHRAVVRVLDFGHLENGDPFLVMELLRGEDLRAMVQRRVRIPPEEAVSLLLPAAEGLAAAHAQQIVHRDLKPENIFVTETARGRQPKILDFGIALGIGARVDGRVTGSGCVVGSPEYMAPEQAEGREELDPRADVWSFCCVLYECVTGRRPYAFDGNYERLLRRVIEEPVEPLSEHGIEEPELWAILSRGFEKDRAARFATVEDLGAALARWLIARGKTEDACGTSLRTGWLRGETAAEGRGMVDLPVRSKRLDRGRIVIGAAVAAAAFAVLAVIGTWARPGGGNAQEQTAGYAEATVVAPSHDEASPATTTPVLPVTLSATAAEASPASEMGRAPEPVPRALRVVSKHGESAVPVSSREAAHGAEAHTAQDHPDRVHDDLTF